MGLASKVLISVLGIGVAGSLVGMGTFAAFTAQTTNPSTFTTGFLTMTNVTAASGTGTDCSTATINGTCDSIATSGNMSNLIPGGSVTGDVTIATQMAGGTATTIKLWATSVASDAGASSAVACTTGTLPAQYTIAIQGDPTGASFNVYTSGAFSSFPATEGAPLTIPVASGNNNWTNGSTQTYRITMTFSNSATSAHADCSLAVTFNWKAELA